MAYNRPGYAVAGASVGPQGVAGADAVAVAFNNPAVALAASSAGVVASYATTPAIASVRQGSSGLQYEAGAGYPVVAGRFRIEVAASSITAGAITVSGTSASIAAASNMTANMASITYTLRIKTLQYADVAVAQMQTFSKAVAGDPASNLVTSVAGKQGIVILGKADVNLGSVDNTPDASKPVSAPQQTALDLKSNLATSLTVKSTLGTADLDTFVAPGLHLQTSSANTSFALHYPILNSGWLQVISSGAGATSGVVQVYYASNTNRIFFRTLVLTVWKPWLECLAADSNNAVLINGAVANGTDKLLVAGSANLSGPLKPGSYTLATLPSAATYSGYFIDVSNATGGSKLCRSNGTNWLIVNTSTTVS